MRSPHRNGDYYLPIADPEGGFVDFFYCAPNTVDFSDVVMKPENRSYSPLERPVSKNRRLRNF